MGKFWVYLDNKVQGPMEVPNLRKMGGFTLLTQVCADGQSGWELADNIVEIKAYFSAPPRATTLPFEMASLTPSNTIVLEPNIQPQSETLKPNPVELNKPVSTSPTSGPSKGALRIACPVCDYKNPRESKICMKCGELLKEDAPLEKNAPIPSLVIPKIEEPEDSFEPMEILEEPSEEHEKPTIHVPMGNIVMIFIALSAVLGGGFGGYGYWHHLKMKKAKIAHDLALPPTPIVNSIPGKKSLTNNSRSRKTKRISHRRRIVRALPGISGTVRHPSSRHTMQAGENVSSKPGDSYEVLDEAAPIKKRQSSPEDSPYATKRRAQKSLWTGAEKKAMSLVQRTRIYGGKRTVARNTEILMQILRDKEYLQAFEKGKRLYLYNDMDWDAVNIQGPVYEVHLTLSGGKETDGTPRKPLRFAFEADLERETVQASGPESVKSNTLHAFFDESRIPSEERSAVVRDTEELILAAAPEGSPLALQTIVRQFIATYSQPVLDQIVEAYHLDTVNKVLLKEQPKTLQKLNKNAGETADGFTKSMTQAVNPKDTLVSITKGDIDCKVVRGAGPERLIAVRTSSTASKAKLWETLTSYENFSKFLPDVLISQREGQDGKASVIHAVALTRWMFFVFKMNVHLRIVESAEDHTIEFERIAGDFDKLKGKITLSTDPTNPQVTQILYQASLDPKGIFPDWILRPMSQRFLIPVFEALRARAEKI